MSLQPQEITRRRSASALCALLEDARDILLGSEGVFALNKVAVLTEDDGDVDTEIEQQVGALGIVATVMLVSADNAGRNMPGPVFADTQLIVEISELAVVNRAGGGTQVTCLEAAEDAARSLHQARCASGRMLLVTNIRKYPQPPKPATVCYHVVCTTGDVQITKRS